MAEIRIAADTATIVLNGRIYTALAQGDYVSLTYPNEKTSRVNHAAGGVNTSPRADAQVCDFVMRVQKYSADDIVLNAARNQQSPVVFDGSVKEAFTSDGVDGVESHTLEKGTFTAQPTETKNNQDGSAMVEYTIQFRRAIRNL